MARALTADPSERLPWLNDAAPAPAPAKSLVPVLFIALAAGAAGAAGWTTLQRAIAPEQPSAQATPVKTVQLPPPVAAEPVERTAVSASEALALPPPPSMRKAEPTPAPKVEAARPAKPKGGRASRSERRKATPKQRILSKPVARLSAVAATSTSATYDPRAWNSGVQGRIIQLGAFRSPSQANGQWNRVYYRYPLLRPLPPRVVRTNIRGKNFYRLQLGTFSHAHSEMLCQRLRAIGEGCIVLGLKRRGRRA